MSGLGIDHPLVAVRDIDAARQTYLSLGFKMKPPGQHPWGTSTALVIFKNQLLELVGIGDPSLLDTYPAGDFLFGRHIEHWLNEREGVALSALNSENAPADAAQVVERGGICEGRIDFGRDVVREDGSPDRTSTTLAILTREGLPRLSMFACQQHRRDLIEFPTWMDHPNGALGFAAATILADRSEWTAVKDWLSALYGTDAISQTVWGFCAETAKGVWRVTDRDGASELFGALPKGLAADGAPSVISLDLECADLSLARRYVEAAGMAYQKVSGALVVCEPERLGGILLTFQTAVQ